MFRDQRFPIASVAMTAFAMLVAVSLPLHAAESAPGNANRDATDALMPRIAVLDTAVFDAFNHCDQPGQLEKHAAFFDTHVEFYHDTGGVTWTRDAMLANTKKNVCGHFRRELVPGSLRVYPIKDFGAVELGTHRFCQIDTGKCEGIADFTIVWRQQNDQWQITRVLSYGHRATKPGE